jgi:hypothetical protein
MCMRYFSRFQLLQTFQHLLVNWYENWCENWCENWLKTGVKTDVKTGVKTGQIYHVTNERGQIYHVTKKYYDGVPLAIFSFNP